MVDAPFVSSYIHGANRIGVLVGMNKDADEVGKKRGYAGGGFKSGGGWCCECSCRCDCPRKSVIMEIMWKKIQNGRKPEEMLAKIAEGKLEFLKNKTLTAQSYKRWQQISRVIIWKKTVMLPLPNFKE